MTTPGRGRPEEVKQAIAQQERANAVVMAALNDNEFMAGVLEARKQESEGQEGELLSDVIKRLGIVPA
jgi:hypothetical protein